ncbi:hypothetical protein ACTSKR_01505 [Chitinibacteraceae bacterium HSL-7]
MNGLFASLYNAMLLKDKVFAIGDRVNREAGFGGAEKVDGRVMNVFGERARICWPGGRKSMENVADLVRIAE